VKNKKSLIFIYLRKKSKKKESIFRRKEEWKAFKKNQVLN